MNKFWTAAGTVLLGLIILVGASEIGKALDRMRVRKAINAANDAAASGDSQMRVAA